ncbi:MAG TPA: ATP synthase F1 subunit epsilon [Actinomycetota bacterium]|nr:ATP synthase F1 subunit epsilon [Actinomycetota bacterium]
MDVSIVSPAAKVWQGEADMVVARSPEGEFAILRGHIPFLAALVPGVVKVVSGDRREQYFVTGGVLEASGTADDYHVIVLADRARRVGDLDLDAARRMLEEQRNRMEDTDERAEAQMRAALARVEIAQQESLS